MMNYEKDVLIHKGNLPEPRFTCDMKPSIPIFSASCPWVEVIDSHIKGWDKVYLRIMAKGTTKDWAPAIYDLMNRLNLEG